MKKDEALSLFFDSDIRKYKWKDVLFNYKKKNI